MKTSLAGRRPAQSRLTNCKASLPLSVEPSKDGITKVSSWVGDVWLQLWKGPEHEHWIGVLSSWYSFHQHVDVVLKADPGPPWIATRTTRKAPSKEMPSCNGSFLTFQLSRFSRTGGCKGTCRRGTCVCSGADVLLLGVELSFTYRGSNNLELVKLGNFCSKAGQSPTKFRNLALQLFNLSQDPITSTHERIL